MLGLIKKLLDWFIMGFILNSFFGFLLDVLCVCINIGLFFWWICGNLLRLVVLKVECIVEDDLFVSKSERLLSCLFDLDLIIG